MPLCGFAPGFGVYDVTPLENLFILEYMLGAPGDYVKVYVYGLYQCYQARNGGGSLENFASDLGMEAEMVRRAFTFWQRKGVLRVSAEDPLQVEYCNLKGISLEGGDTGSCEVYTQFNRQLSILLGGRQPRSHELMKAYEWLDVLGFSEEAVLCMVSHCVDTKGMRVSFNYIHKLALDWAAKGVRTLEEAMAAADQYRALHSGASQVLHHLGMYRAPSVDERGLYEKWTKSWGFDLPAIQAACKEVTKVGRPSLAYLDKILDSLHADGLLCAPAIQGFLEQRDQLSGEARKVVLALGGKGTSATAAQIALVEKWQKDWALSLPLILSVAHTMEGSSMNALNAQLETWYLKGYSPKEIEASMQRRAQADAALAVHLRTLGLPEGSITVNQRAAYARWTKEWGMEDAVVGAAAALAVSATHPWQYMSRTLSNWHAKGVCAVGQIPAEKQAAMTKQVDGLKYQNREYAEGELDEKFGHSTLEGLD